MKNITKKISIILLLTLIIQPLNTFAYTKTETVYANINQEGKVIDTNVNISLSNLEYKDIVDYTNLEKIKNVNGDEKFTRESNKITWKSTGKDIFYKGNTTQELPITINAKYYLNDEEKEYNDIVGKKGTVKIVYTFKNNLYDYNTGLYTPFVVTAVSTIPTKNNSHVTITNGKVVSTGSNNIVTAISAPGLYESTKLEDLKNIDEITITYDTEKFKNNDIYFIMTPKLLDEVDINNFNKLNNLNNSVNTLKNGVNELQNASQTITDGSNNLTTGLQQLNAGLNEALNGSEKLFEGLSQINNNTKDIESLTTLVETLYNTYQNNLILLSNISNGTTQSQLEEGIKNATEEKTSLENKLKEVETYITTLEQLKNNNQINEEQQVQLNNLYYQKQQLENGIMEYSKGISQAQTNLKSLPLGAAKITGANEVIEKVLCGILKVEKIEDITEEQLSTFNLKINTLVSGINQLTEGSKDLNTGLTTLTNGSKELVEGSSKLSNGNKQLQEGVTRLNNEGINKLVSYKNTLINYSNKIEELIKLSKNYKGFSSDNIDKTIFIYKIAK